jgi:hypothetical protein
VRVKDDPISDVRPVQTLQDLALDGENANLETDRGEWALRDSLIRFGVGLGVLADRQGRLIGGNKTYEALEAQSTTCNWWSCPRRGIRWW